MTDTPAFPTKTFTRNGYPAGESMGMSLRDYFAGQALAGITGNKSFFGPTFQQHPNAAAEFAYQCADAMLSERKKDNPND